MGLVVGGEGVCESETSKLQQPQKNAVRGSEVTFVSH